MAGILLLGVACIWLICALKIAFVMSSDIKQKKYFWPVFLFLFLFLLIIPLGDEVVSGIQFHSMCKEIEKIHIDEKYAAGRDARISGKVYTLQPPGTLLVIDAESYKLSDAHSNEEIASYKIYHAHGGWLMGLLHISQTDSPLIFARTCGPGEEVSIFEKLNINILK